jgi:hypothetical protein
MSFRNPSRALILAMACAVSLPACQSARTGTPATDQAAPVAASADAISFDLAFVTHLDVDLPEQDAYIEREAGSGELFRVTKGDLNMDAELFKTTEMVEHDPFDPTALGPHAKGERLGMTLGEWLRHEGTGNYRFENGQGHLKLSFKGLVPNGVYTLWHSFVTLPPTKPFNGALDVPLGPRDGSGSVFTADENGVAEFEHSFAPGLQLSDTWTQSMLAVAYHSDGKTYGGLPGEFGRHTHVPLFTALPLRAGLE